MDQKTFCVVRGIIPLLSPHPGLDDFIGFMSHGYHRGLLPCAAPQLKFTLYVVQWLAAKSEIDRLAGDHVQMQFIQTTDNDDPRFLALASCALANHIRQMDPIDLFVVRIDHWFDHKWLAFAGKLLGAVSVHKSRRLTIPPFIPGRVISEHAFTLDRDVYRKRQAPSLHRRQRSGENLSRSIGNVSESGVFVWFSGDTLRCEHGSIMLYAIQGETQRGWYASFRRGTDWRLFKTVGISRAELMRMTESEVVA